MVVVLLVLFLFIPACIALFMSGRSLLLIFLGAVACQAAVAVAFAGLSARGWSESMGSVTKPRPGRATTLARPCLSWQRWRLQGRMSRH